jgi:hypothetical protein
MVMTAWAVTLAQIAPAPQAQAGVAAKTVPGAGEARGAPASGLANVAVLDVVMLVDESGSETPQKVADEKQTVSTIVQSMLNPLSRVTVVGFGGVNHVRPNQNPVNVACVPTIASGQGNLSYLASCVNSLKPRTEQQGDDTDYAAALGQAMSYFSPASTVTPVSPPGAIKVILMMTDGAVDVHRDTQQYGTNWQEGEKVAIGNQLSAAMKYDVQVWPLGFGTDIGTGLTEPQALTYLNNIARGGASAVCDKQHAVNQPHAIWVNNPDNAISALNELYSDAACLGSSTTSTVVQGGQNGALSVSIPEIASDAAITVDRVNPNITVGFTRPDGRMWTDSSAISGQDSSPVVVLHLADISAADVGTWKINLTAPPGLASQLVSATVFWQGAVRAVITATPPSAKLGQPISVALDVLGPNGPITDASAVKNLFAGVTVTGVGLTRPTSVKVSQLAGSPGAYQGTYTAPRQPGTLTFTGSASGNGLFATEVPTDVAVGSANPQFTATVAFPLVTSVQAGSSLTGQLIFTNKTGSAKQVRLLLSTTGATASITSPAGSVSVPSPNPASVPVTLSFAKRSPTGAAWLRVEVVDAADQAVVYNAVRLDLKVTKPPGFIEKYLWLIIGIIALIALVIAAILWRRAVIRARKDVRGLVATLKRDGQELGRPLAAPGRWADTFRFIIRDEQEPVARLDFPASGFSVYQVKRSRPGEVKLITPTAGEPYDVVVGGPGEVMDHNGLALSFRDSRRKQVRRGVPGSRGSAARPGSSGQGPAPAGAPSAGSPAPGGSSPGGSGQGGTVTSGSGQQKDEWL